jgi:hypothetical protein
MKFKEIFESLSRKNPVKDRLKKEGKWNSKNKMPENIYGSETYSEEWHNFDKFHYSIKYKILVPALKFVQWKWGELLDRPIPKGNHNDMLVMFDKCYDEALNDWNRYYLNVTEHWKKADGKEVPYNKKRAARMYHNQLLRTMKNILKTGYLYDSAYREFANILMMKLYLAQKSMFKDKSQLTHLFYSSADTRQISYFKIYTEVKEVAQNINKDIHMIPESEMEGFKKEIIQNYLKEQESKQGLNPKVLSSDDLKNMGVISKPRLSKKGKVKK